MGHHLSPVSAIWLYKHAYKRLPALPLSKGRRFTCLESDVGKLAVLGTSLATLLTKLFATKESMSLFMTCPERRRKVTHKLKFHFRENVRRCEVFVVVAKQI